MPGRPYRRCARPGCARRTRTRYCADDTPKRSRGRGFYRSAGWRLARVSYLRSAGYRCERCGERANTVHHRDPAGADLDPSNLEALCPGCHNRAHPEKGGGSVSFGPPST
ncbi:HNH endonuclease [Candidatus Palauibacter sp.]|uniref:HNH endonuclease n=1 Tax=Candidatus Palauibacter sp. TaxID=3101350 RepID=UPI003CC650E8